MLDDVLFASSESQDELLALWNLEVRNKIYQQAQRHKGETLQKHILPSLASVWPSYYLFFPVDLWKQEEHTQAFIRHTHEIKNNDVLQNSPFLSLKSKTCRVTLE